MTILFCVRGFNMEDLVSLPTLEEGEFESLFKSAQIM